MDTKHQIARLRGVLASRALRLLVACAVLVALYWFADWRFVARAVAGLQPGYLLLTLLLFVPQTLVSATRWRLLVKPLCRITTLEAVRQTLAASAVNLFVPSKMGDFSKAAMLPVDDEPQYIGRTAKVVTEKLLDVTALVVIMLLGLAAGFSAWAPVVAGVCALLLGFMWWARRRPHTVLSAAAQSIVLWTLHLAQIDLFLKSAGVYVSWHVAAARIPAAIFAGLLPITFWGVGTRDSALVWLFSDVAPMATMAAVGLLTASRYLIPGLAGVAVLACRGTRPSDARSRCGDSARHRRMAGSRIQDNRASGVSPPG